MIKLKQAVIVEGKYDKAKLSSLVDATIVTTDGFDVFRDREKLAYIRALAEKNGVIILTDSDAAGFRIRAHIAGAVDPEKITHVYIPDIFGKERRKAQPSAEGKLGVEGMPAGVLLDALRRAGVAVEGQDAPAPAKRAAPVSKADLVEWGLSGGPDSAGRRRRVLAALGLPARMNANAMLSAINALYTRGEFLAFLETH
ncbi:DUF4093 domain-containing protein [Anaerotruncus massiliensis (ex Liu et al. 2021)]|uniref:DUF4093 domain-containing protein n=2 Tax=Anaerotruncus TaxID=244127 RepID=A0A498CQF9_9FIRM|nr:MULTISPECIES: DUF4093 domain-containing protein [Anaerotruncus]MBC3937911.1 DUF4093 domain-containing protein [Anaerotruncus massiliensis (ex Togo et al. 2019)]RLL13905.1 DUF4093 domain-containing protein [Anaerotruncus massiliensis (ex Liu et al. 2021)]